MEGDRTRAGRRGATLVVAASALLLTAPGCVERRYTIRSDPPGALVIVNGEEIGPTPVSRSFVFYNDREITLMADGYKTQTFIQPINAPWYDNLLTEVFTENLWPFTIRDEREFTFKLSPYAPPPIDDLTARAENLRAQGQTQPKKRRPLFFGLFGPT